MKNRPLDPRKTFIDGPTYVGPRWHEVPSGKVFAPLFTKSGPPEVSNKL